MATAVASNEAVRRGWRLQLPERLSDITGNWLTAYRATWIVAAVLALLSATILSYRNEVADQARVKRFTAPNSSPGGASRTERISRPSAPRRISLGCKRTMCS